MSWFVGVVPAGRRFSTAQAYRHARVLAASLHAPQPVGWWGLCALLSGYQVERGAIQPMPALWAELLPFLLIRDERLAAKTLHAYLAYLTDPRGVDLQWLGLRLNEALERAETWNDQVAEVLEDPGRALEARWLALLSYQSLLRLHKAVALYGGEGARVLRRTYWHGVHAQDAAMQGTSLANGRLYPLPVDSLVRSRLRPAGRLPATFRRFRASQPTVFS